MDECNSSPSATQTVRNKAPERWSTELTARFLTAYSKEPSLWDVRHIYKRDPNYRETALKRIVSEMNLENFNTDLAQRKASTLKTTYFAERKKIESGIACGNPYKTKLVWYSLADMFLNDVGRQPMEESSMADLDSIMPITLCKDDSPEERKQKLDVFSELIAKQLRRLPLEDALKVQMEIVDAVLKRRLRVLQRDKAKNSFRLS